MIFSTPTPPPKKLIILSRRDRQRHKFLDPQAQIRHKLLGQFLAPTPLWGWGLWEWISSPRCISAQTSPRGLVYVSFDGYFYRETHPSLNSLSTKWGPFLIGNATYQFLSNNYVFRLRFNTSLIILLLWFRIINPQLFRANDGEA